MPPDRLNPVIRALVTTLRDEADALDTLNALFDRQIDAIRNGAAETLKEMSAETHTVTDRLHVLRQKRARQLRLLSRLLDIDDDDVSVRTLLAAVESTDTIRTSGPSKHSRTLVMAMSNRASDAVKARLSDARAAVERRAQEAHRRGETLRVSLEVAASLNRELLIAMHDAADTSDTSTYTAAGQAEAASSRSFVNAVG
jgi:hypothetical protein